MIPKSLRRSIAHALCLATLLAPAVANANAYREKGKPATIAKTLSATPPRDWNRLTISPGKNVETWTLDGEQLNDVTFYAGIAAGKPLIRERDRKRRPLPKFTNETLLVEVPELLEKTYRISKEIGTFTVTGSAPERFLGRDGIRFTYEYADVDNLSRKGEARATLVNGALYMVTFDAPRLYYFDRSITDYHALVEATKLS